MIGLTFGIFARPSALCRPSAQICFPSGSILYYGRVTPKACVAIVEQTILKGKVLPEHLRGGANLTRPTGQTLLDW